MDDTHDAVRARLTDWFAAQLRADPHDVRIEGLDRVEIGHSAETMLLTLVRAGGGDDQRRDLVVRARPPSPGLLEPYDLRRQFTILRALEPTPVPSPAVLWYEDSPDVLGREFYVMERLDGTVYERTIPPELASSPERLRAMSRSMAEAIASIHRVDLSDAGLQALGDGKGYLERELDHWAGEMHRVQRGTLPALERLLAELRERQPEQSPTVTLVHGDPKPGNFAFVGDDVSGVFDWELSTLGDPLADIGWAELNWTMPGSFTREPGALTVDEFVELYQHVTGIDVVHREWYRAFQGFKMIVILLVGAMLFDGGHSDDLRFVDMGFAVDYFTTQMLASLGVDTELESGPVTAREERVREVRERQLAR